MRSGQGSLLAGRVGDWDWTLNRAEAEVVQVAVEEWILIVPLDFQRHSVLVAVNLVGWIVSGLIIDHHLGVECLLDPPTRFELAVDCLRDQGLAASWHGNVRFLQPEVG